VLRSQDAAAMRRLDSASPTPAVILGLLVVVGARRFSHGVWRPPSTSARSTPGGQAPHYQSPRGRN